MKKILVCLSIFLTLGCTLSKKAIQQVEVQDSQQETGQILERPVLSEFILGPGDEMKITVWRHEDLSRTVTVSRSGLVTYPMVGDVQVNGMGVTQFRDVIRDGIAKIILDPQVSVEVASSRRNKVFVLGEVKSPGIFQIETEMNVVEAISHAGGFTPNANMKNVLLIRGDMDNPVLKKLDVKRAFKKGDLIHNVALLQGDILYIPSTPIANVETFFKRISNIIAPIVELERGIIFEPLLEDVFKGEELRVPAGVVR